MSSTKLILLGLTGIGVLAFAMKSRATISLPPATLLGDVDGDGVITENDAVAVAQYVVGTRQLTPEQLANADVDCDGKVTINDALFIQQYVKGIITEFPCEGTW